MKLWSKSVALIAIFVATMPVPVGGQGPASPPTGRYVVLVALEGFRWDYAERYSANNLLALGKRGVAAPRGMLPSFPAERLPNLYTIVTGLYPGHHGMVADSFFDPAQQAQYSSTDEKTAGDGSWYGGVPLWSLAEKQGIRTACAGWPGCNAEIAGARPKYVGRSGADSDVVRQVLDWLKLPAPEQPRFIAVAFDELERTARRFGPDAQETRAAARRMDALIGRLKAGLDATRLPIDLIVVSDHGLAKPDGGWVTLDECADLKNFETAGTLLYGKTEPERERAYNQLKKASSQFVAYRLKSAPAGLHLYQNPRMGDPVTIATGPYAMRAHAAMTGSAGAAASQAVAGFDPHFVPEMKAVFIAAGPDIVEGKPVASFDSVHLYPWLAYLLGLAPPKTDGSLNILSGSLRDSGETGH